MNRNIKKSPGGMRSYLPDTVLEMNEIEEKINQVFKIWGYQPIITPTLEYYDSLLVGMGTRLKKEIYKFIDYEGNILALRPEMTAPIARTIASRIDELTFPQRLSYRASVFKYDQPQVGKNREIFQLGVELIGEKSYLADAETIILAIESLLNTGIKGFKIDIGHAGYLEGIMERTELAEEEKITIKRCLTRRDLVGLKEEIDSLKMSASIKELILSLPTLRGGREILEKAIELAGNNQSVSVIKNLAEVYNYLEDYGYGEYIEFDLSLLRGFDYYTGLVFEGFTEKLGYTICGGGRYDHLLEQFSGQSIPAIGFAIGLERVRLALKKQEYNFRKEPDKTLVVFTTSTRKQALKVVKKWHSQNQLILMIERDVVDSRFINGKFKEGINRIISFSAYTEVDKQLEIYWDDREKEVVKLEDVREGELWLN